MAETWLPAESYQTGAERFQDGVAMGQQIGGALMNIRGALQDRAKRKQADEVVGDVQAQMDELKNKHTMAHTALTEKLTRVQAGEPMDPKEWQDLSAATLVAGMEYQQKSMDLITNVSVSNAGNQYIQERLGKLGENVQSLMSQSFQQSGKLMEWSAGREDERNANKRFETQHGEDVRQFDENMGQRKEEFGVETKQRAQGMALEGGRLALSRDQFAHEQSQDAIANQRADQVGGREERRLAIDEDANKRAEEAFRVKAPMEKVNYALDLVDRVKTAEEAGVPVEAIKRAAEEAGADPQLIHDVLSKTSALSKEGQAQVRRLDKMIRTEEAKEKPDTDRIARFKDQRDLLSEIEMAEEERNIARANTRLDQGEAVASLQEWLGTAGGGLKEIHKTINALSPRNLGETAMGVVETSETPEQVVRRKTKGGEEDTGKAQDRGYLSDLNSLIKGDKTLKAIRGESDARAHGPRRAGE